MITLNNKSNSRIDITAGERWQVTDPSEANLSEGYAFALCGEATGRYHYKTREARDADLRKLQLLCKTDGGHMFKDLGQDVREFLKSNRDMIWTVIFVLLVDQFAFEGAFRERVKGLLENLLKKAEGKVAPPTAS